MMWIIKTVIVLFIAVLAPIVLPFAIKKDSPRLRKWAWMWDTPDQKLPGGLYEPKVASIFERYGYWWCSYYWLLRNPAYGISKYFSFVPDSKARVTIRGNPYISDDSEIRGVAYYTITNPGGSKSWELYGVIGKTFGIRFRFGWKLQPWIQRFVEKNESWYKLDGTSTGDIVIHISVRRLK